MIRSGDLQSGGAVERGNRRAWSLCAKTAVAIMLAVVVVGNAYGQSSRRAVIEQALTEPTRIVLEQVPLRDAIASITQQTGVEIIMPQDVMALVPGGGGLVIQQVDIANIPLREGLDQLFAPLGMTWRVSEEGVHIQPRDAIRCLGRVPTWEELDTLAKLSDLNPSSGPDAREAIRKRLRFEVPVQDPWSVLEPAMRDAGAGPADAVLSLACEKLGWSWCLSGKWIVVTSREQEIIRRLQRPISLRLRGDPLFDVLVAVGDAVGVKIRIEAGALAPLPLPVQQSFTLEIEDQTGERAFESIAAYTGLSYLVEPQGVLFYYSGAPTSGPAQSSGRDGQPSRRGSDPYVGKVVVPLDDGTTLEWLVRYSELPPDMKTRRAQDLRRAFEALE